MRPKSPSSRGFFKARLSAFDVIWAMLAPPLALYLTNAQVLKSDIDSVLLYCTVSSIFSLAAFLGFRIRDGLTEYFSVNDALAILKAVIAAGLMTSSAIFLLTRLEGIPRSAAIVHALVLAAGLVLWRLLVRMAYAEVQPAHRPSETVAERILMVGATRLAAQYIQLLDSYSGQRQQVVALLDDGPKRIGRSIFGIRVVGPSSQLRATIDEYAIHGIHIDRVIIAGDDDLLPQETLAEIRRACSQYPIRLDFIPALIGLHKSRALDSAAATQEADTSAQLPSYLQIKRGVDLVFTLALIVLLSPLLLAVCVLAFVDVGSPIFFWQQRIGQHGRSFLLYKVRTLRPPFDWMGQSMPDDKRLSWIGAFLRKTRLDEFPQLLNVLVGDMSLIGPRPLLPQDQPENPAVRLTIRPGLTGWAQVNGGVSLSPKLKNELDEWYVRNASPALDLRIMFMTMRFLFTGELGPSPAATAGGGANSER